MPRRRNLPLQHWSRAVRCIQKLYHWPHFTVGGSWNKSLHLQQLQRCYCENAGSTVNACAVASRNIRFASCGTSWNLTLWTRYVLLRRPINFSLWYIYIYTLRRATTANDAVSKGRYQVMIAVRNRGTVLSTWSEWRNSKERYFLCGVCREVKSMKWRYKIINRNCLKENLKEKEKLVTGPRWAPDAKTDWPTDCRS
jgi:hypothetical protein